MGLFLQWNHNAIITQSHTQTHMFSGKGYTMGLPFGQSKHFQASWQGIICDVINIFQDSKNAHVNGQNNSYVFTTNYLLTNPNCWTLHCQEETKPREPAEWSLLCSTFSFLTPEGTSSKALLSLARCRLESFLLLFPRERAGPLSVQLFSYNGQHSCGKLCLENSCSLTRLSPSWVLWTGISEERTARALSAHYHMGFALYYPKGSVRPLLF